MARYIASFVLVLWGGVVLGAAIYDSESGGNGTIKQFAGLIMGTSLVGTGTRSAWNARTSTPASVARVRNRRDELADWRFPGGSGPFVGLVVGAVIGLRLAIRNGHFTALESVLLATGLGIIGGFVMWGIDAIRYRGGSS